MASGWNVGLCAIAATLFWSAIGWPLGYRMSSDRSLGLALAPALGWAVFNAAALPIFLVVGFSVASVATVSALALILALAGSVRVSRQPGGSSMPAIPPWIYAAAAVIAIAPALAVMPKFGGSGVFLAEPMFDHSKVAMIDDMARLGLPPGNPFFAPAGESARFAYYYLWHFSAALFPLLLRVSGWEADIALTWFTAFASLTLMMGFAVWFSGRRMAALWVLALSLAISLRPLLAAIFGEAALDRVLSPAPVVQGWIEQASWVPQHLAGASCAILAVFLVTRLMENGRWLVIPVLALVVAAGFESSTWIGGIVFAAATPVLGLALLLSAPPGERGALLARAALAAILALIIAAPFLHDEYIATAARSVGVPIGLEPYHVFGTLFPPALRRALDLPGFWLILLPVKLPAVFITGIIGVSGVIGARSLGPEQHRAAMAMAILTAVGFGIAWLFASTIANNDLGWRAILPGVMALTIFASVALMRWLTLRRVWAAIAAMALLALGLPDGLRFIAQNAQGYASPDATAFAATPDLWAAVRRHTAPDERVGNNPLFLGDMVRWPVNISWALLADRRSCFAGWNLARAYVALPGAGIDRINTLFEQVFAGNGTADDVHALAREYDCRVIVVVPSDGAWRHDPFATSPDYRLAEDKPERWRIYRRSDETAGGS
jgi:hypothetical protein